MAFLAYLAAWTAVAIAAVAAAIPRRGAPRLRMTPTAAALLATLLQAGSALAITLFLPEGPLRPHAFEWGLALMLAPLGAALYVWAQRSAVHGGLVTAGAYAYLRHPIYTAFLALLLATGLLASARANFAIAVALYVAGTELRIRDEESWLTARFAEAYANYARRTRWRYLPGIR